ncbi:alpha/beta hydrolase [Qipengyuania vesicularis]|uniref:alpha/beta hydrolase n=1 Tax=Qipengyuania vesicularis TaxID=2867232 RepID=UPI001C88C3AB|nr:alpha/beta hydrolase [Qipengyuania vesicularis]MBX7527165.1 alpha/beta hydrolase [Qipengyuania vesicularis]
MRAVIALGVATLALSSQPAFAEPFAEPETVEIETPDARQLPVRVWQPEEAPRGVVLFSHGFNSWPAAYEALLAKLTGEGLAVVAPLHPDSMRSSLEGKISPQQAFAARMIDMQLASDMVGERFEGLPILAVGHSFGTLDAMVRAGGLPALGAPTDEGVSAILAFSTPGKIPGLIGDDAFSAVGLPTMLVTGDSDTVPGFVADPADHRIYAERVSGPSYLVSVEGGDHDLVGNDAIMAQVWPAVSGFIAVHLLDEAETPALARYALEKPSTAQQGDAE